MILSCMCSKGGPGKSTITTNLAVHWAVEEEYDVLILDADPQNSVYKWGLARQNNGAKNIDVKTIDFNRIDNLDDFIDFVEEQKQNYDIILIDVPGRDDELFRWPMGVCDFALLVVDPGGFNAFSYEDDSQTLEEAQGWRLNLGLDPFKAAIVFNRVHSDYDTIARAHKAAIENDEYQWPLVEQYIHQFQSAKRAASHGYGISEVSGGEKCAQQFKSLAQEIANMLYGDEDE